MTDDFDDAIRSRLQGDDVAPTGDARAVLAELQPAMRRARVKRSAALGAAAFSLLGLTGVGIAAVITVANDEPAEVEFFDDGEPLPNVGPTTSMPDSDDETDDELDDDSSPSGSTTTSVVPTTTEPPATSTTQPPAADTTAVPDSEPVTTSPATSPAAPASSEPPTTAAPASTSPPTTSPPAATTTSPPSTNPPPSSGQQTVVSNCGSITVAWTGSNISLVGTQPGSGFSAIIDDTGPDEVEVSFVNGDTECEIKARIDDGSLRTDIDND